MPRRAAHMLTLPLYNFHNSSDSLGIALADLKICSIKQVHGRLERDICKEYVRARTTLQIFYN